eukprot:g12386.t1
MGWLGHYLFGVLPITFFLHKAASMLTFFNDSSFQDFLNIGPLVNQTFACDPRFDAVQFRVPGNNQMVNVLNSSTQDNQYVVAPNISQAFPNDTIVPGIEFRNPGCIACDLVCGNPNFTTSYSDRTLLCPESQNADFLVGFTAPVTRMGFQIGSLFPRAGETCTVNISGVGGTLLGSAVVGPFIIPKEELFFGVNAQNQLIESVTTHCQIPGGMNTHEYLVEGVDGRFELLEVECWGFFNPNDDE